MWAWHLVWAGQRHHDVLLLDVAPAVEDREDGEEEEDVSPLEQEVVGVERLQQARGHDPEDQEVEEDDGAEPAHVSEHSPIFLSLLAGSGSNPEGTGLSPPFLFDPPISLGTPNFKQF